MATAFRITLTGDQEVPPTGSTARGLGTVIFDPTAVAAAYSIRYVGLDFGPVLGLPAQTATTADDITMHHVHNAPRGVNGPVVFGQINPNHDADDLVVAANADGSWTVSGRWETTDPANVSISTFASQLGSAQVGSDVSLYFNAHTTAFPAGEIRGQWVTIANDQNNTVLGTADDDHLPGLGGDDRLLGRAGNDRLDGGAGNDRANGEDGDDRLIGGSGNDLLIGGLGEDRLNGGRGNDHLSGGDGADRLDCGPGNDRANGGSGNDLLLGGSGNDGLNGSTGDDGLLGGFGRDSLQGGDGDDRLRGGFGDDRLNGGADADTLVGNLGFDKFVFSTALGTENVDTIRDFNVFADTILLDNVVFTGLSAGNLSDAAFHIGTAATANSDRIIYNSNTGALYFDPDGVGGAGQTQFATLLRSPNNVTASEFFVI
jgi:Ca2+-binding RTX toxin-like protein